MRKERTCQWYSVCPIKRFTEKKLIAPGWVERYCKSAYWRCVRRKMQEKGQYHPDNMLPDGSIDEKLSHY